MKSLKKAVLLAVFAAAILCTRSLPAADPSAGVAAANPGQSPGLLGWLLHGLADKPAAPPRDPTAASPQIQQLLATGNHQSAELPTIELKGRVVTGGNSTAALLAIDKRLFQVQQGSRIPLQIVGAKFSGLAVEVKEITAQTVRLDVGPAQLGRQPAVRGAELILY